MKKFIASIVLLVGICFIGCTDSTMASLGSYGQRHHVRMFNGGTLVAEWYSTGKVTTMSDGWQFMDEKTHKLVRVGGDVIIEIAK